MHLEFLTGDRFRELQRVCLQDVDGIAFSTDGRHIVSGSTDGVVRTWNVRLAELAHQSPTSRDREYVRNFAISANGRRTGDNMSSVRDTETGYHLLEHDAPEDSSSIALNEDGPVAAFGSKYGVVGVWNPAVPCRPNTQSILHQVEVTHLAMDSKGSRTVSIARNNHIRIWLTKGAESKRKAGP